MRSPPRINPRASKLLQRYHNPTFWGTRRYRATSTLSLAPEHSRPPLLKAFLFAGGIAAGYIIHAFVTPSPDSRTRHEEIQTKLPEALPAEPVGSGDTADIENALKSALVDSGNKVTADSAVLAGFGSAPGTSYPPTPPIIVVYPTCTADVQAAVKVSRNYRVPVIPVSGHTSLEGHTIPSPDTPTIIISFERMNRILEIDEMNGDAVVQPGVGWEQLNEELLDRGIGLMFPVGPGPSACFGGMAASGGSGPNALRYGTMKGEWVLNATVVLPSGEVIKTRSRARKSATGFDVTKLFLGSEGTLGILTELTVKLTPLLPTTVAVLPLPSISAASRSAVALLNAGIPLSCCELLDTVGMRAVQISYRPSELPFALVEGKPYMFLKFSGRQQAVDEAIQQARDVLEKLQPGRGKELKVARSQEEGDAIWAIRKGIFWTQQNLVPGCRTLVTDVCVPLGRLPELIELLDADIRESGLVAPILGHVGDGNVHAAILISPEQSYASAVALASKISHHAIALGGTCSGEHGIGMSKKQYLAEELGSGTVQLMKEVKKLIDPHNLFNPGKLYPD